MSMVIDLGMILSAYQKKQGGPMLLMEEYKFAESVE
jgi:hypothetical protein